MHLLQSQYSTGLVHCYFLFLFFYSVTLDYHPFLFFQTDTNGILQRDSKSSKLIECLCSTFYNRAWKAQIRHWKCSSDGLKLAIVLSCKHFSSTAHFSLLEGVVGCCQVCKWHMNNAKWDDQKKKREVEVYSCQLWICVFSQSSSGFAESYSDALCLQDRPQPDYLAPQWCVSDEKFKQLIK